MESEPPSGPLNLPLETVSDYEPLAHLREVDSLERDEATRRVLAIAEARWQSPDATTSPSAEDARAARDAAIITHSLAREHRHIPRRARHLEAATRWCARAWSARAAAPDDALTALQYWVAALLDLAALADDAREVERRFDEALKQVADGWEWAQPQRDLNPGFLLGAMVGVVALANNMLGTGGKWAQRLDAALDLARQARTAAPPEGPGARAAFLSLLHTAALADYHLARACPASSRQERHALEAAATWHEVAWPLREADWYPAMAIAAVSVQALVFLGASDSVGERSRFAALDQALKLAGQSRNEAYNAPPAAAIVPLISGALAAFEYADQLRQGSEADALAMMEQARNYLEDVRVLAERVRDTDRRPVDFERSTLAYVAGALTAECLLGGRLLDFERTLRAAFGAAARLSMEPELAEQVESQLRARLTASVEADPARLGAMVDYLAWATQLLESESLTPDPASALALLSLTLATAIGEHVPVAAGDLATTRTIYDRILNALHAAFPRLGTGLRMSLATSLGRALGAALDHVWHMRRRGMLSDSDVGTYALAAGNLNDLVLRLADSDRGSVKQPLPSGAELLEQVVSAASRDGRLVVVFFDTGERLLRVVVRGNGAVTVDELSRETAVTEYEGYRDALSADLARPRDETRGAETERAVRRLAASLFGGMTPDETTARVLVVPHGFLHAASGVSAWEWARQLGMPLPVIHAPSFGVYAALTQRKEPRPRGARRVTRDVLFVLAADIAPYRRLVDRLGEMLADRARVWRHVTVPVTTSGGFAAEPYLQRLTSDGWSASEPPELRPILLVLLVHGVPRTRRAESFLSLTREASEPWHRLSPAVLEQGKFTLPVASQSGSRGLKPVRISLKDVRVVASGACALADAYPDDRSQDGAALLRPFLLGGADAVVAPAWPVLTPPAADGRWPAIETIWTVLLEKLWEGIDVASATMSSRIECEKSVSGSFLHWGSFTAWGADVCL